jgi:hypothetical protein
MNKINSFISASILSFFSLHSTTSYSEENYLTVTSFLGSRINQDINDQKNDNVGKFSSELTEALALGWKYDTKSEGELLLSNSKQHFSMSGTTSSEMDVYVQYIQLGGKILFTNDSPLSTNIGIGMGITYFNPVDNDFEAKTALSGNMSVGARYQISDQLALRSDLRLYGTRFHTEKNLFCNDGNCLLSLDNSIYLQSELMLGIEYKF